MWSPFGGSMFHVQLVHIREEQRRAGMCWAARHTSLWRTFLTPVSTYLSVRAGVYSGFFQWLCCRAGQEAYGRCTERIIWCVCVCMCSHVFLCVEYECSVSLPGHPAKHRHLHGKLYLSFEVFFMVHKTHVGVH